MKKLLLLLLSIYMLSCSKNADDNYSGGGVEVRSVKIEESQNNDKYVFFVKQYQRKYFWRFF